MAEEAEKEDQKSSEGEEKKKSPLMIIVLGVVVLLLLGGGVFAWKSGMINKMLGAEPGGVSEKIEKKDSKSDIGPIYSLGSFIVNLMEPLGKRYLKVRVELELEDENSKVEIENRLPQLKDSVLIVLGSKNYDDVSSLSGKYQLRAEMISSLNGFMKQGKIRNIYFTEFIVQ